MWINDKWLSDLDKVYLMESLRESFFFWDEIFLEMSLKARCKMGPKFPSGSPDKTEVHQGNSCVCCSWYYKETVCNFSFSGMQFSTKDNDNDHSSSICSQRYKGAWWYNACHRSNLNGLYLNGSHSSYADGVEWYTFRGHHYSLKRTEMKVKTKF